MAKGVHILRHTFCSHLTMGGAPAKAIPELAGDSELGTTQRYMHLSSTALESAIRLLDLRLSLFSGEPAGDGRCWKLEAKKTLGKSQELWR